MRRVMGGLVRFLLPLLLATACWTGHDIDSPLDSSGEDQTTSDTNSSSKQVAAPVMSAAQTLECTKDPVNDFDGLHQSLACAGLYADIGKKTIAAGVEAYVPGLVLWSDGAGKGRWISLPKNKKIDASVASDWVFPEGTKFFKEFKVGNRRVETRLFQKNADGFWVRATYAWNADETAATRSDGGDITVDGNPYHLPTAKECDQCHQGRNERALGFEQIGLSTPGATGLTMAELVKKKLITPVPDETTLAVTDDGHGMQQVAGWLHMNCGVSCHNGNPNASGHSTKLRMRLTPEELDGRPATEYDAFKTTIGVAATTPKWGGKTRIVPGHPEQSLLYQLVSSRGGGENEQMPPIASLKIDPDEVPVIETWIRNLPATANGTTN